MVKEKSYLHIEAFMVNDLKLKGNELLVYAIIFGFSQDEESVYSGSLQYLADWTNSTKRGIIKTLQSLIQKKLIEKNEIFKNGQKFCEYKARVVNKVHWGGELSSLGYGTEFTGGGELSSPNTIYNTIDNTIIDTVSAEPTEKTKKTRKSLLDREPKNDLEKVEKEYLLNYRELHQKGLLKMESPVINWNASRKLTKDTIAKYGLETVLKAIKKSKENQFCVDRGYVLTTILSAGVLAGLINGGKGKKSALDDFEHPDDIMDDVAF